MWGKGVGEGVGDTHRGTGLFDRAGDAGEELVAAVWEEVFDEVEECGHHVCHEVEAGVGASVKRVAHLQADGATHSQGDSLKAINSLLLSSTGEPHLLHRRNKYAALLCRRTKSPGQPNILLSCAREPHLLRKINKYPALLCRRTESPALLRRRTKSPAAREPNIPLSCAGEPNLLLSCSREDNYYYSNNYTYKYTYY